MKLGQILMARGVVSEEEVNQALELQKERGDKIGKILVDLGFVAQREVLTALSEQLSVRLVAIEGPPPVSPVFRPIIGSPRTAASPPRWTILARLSASSAPKQRFSGSMPPVLCWQGNRQAAILPPWPRCASDRNSAFAA